MVLHKIVGLNKPLKSVKWDEITLCGFITNTIHSSWEEIRMRDTEQLIIQAESMIRGGVSMFFMKDKRKYTAENIFNVDKKVKEYFTAKKYNKY